MMKAVMRERTAAWRRHEKFPLFDFLRSPSIAPHLPGLAFSRLSRAHPDCAASAHTNRGVTERAPKRLP
jgi:hypothetical protein